MSLDFTMSCPKCGKTFGSRKWGEAGAPQRCPQCGTDMKLTWYGESENEKHERGRNGINFGQDW